MNHLSGDQRSYQVWHQSTRREEDLEAGQVETIGKETVESNGDLIKKTNDSVNQCID